MEWRHNPGLYPDFNEFYTPADVVDRLLSQIDFGGADVLLPADDQFSEFCLWFLRNSHSAGCVHACRWHSPIMRGLNCPDIELPFDWDLDLGACRHLCENFDGFVITNPPFCLASGSAMMEWHFSPSTTAIVLSSSRGKGLKYKSPAFECDFRTPTGHRTLSVRWNSNKKILL